MIPNGHEERLAQLARVADISDVPPELTQAYHRVRDTYSSMGIHTLTSEAFVLMAMASNVGFNTKVRTFLDDLKDGKVSTNQLIAVRFRNDWCYAKFIRHTPEMKSVIAELLEDSADNREFQYHDARLLTRDEQIDVMKDEPSGPVETGEDSDEIDGTIIATEEPDAVIEIRGESEDEAEKEIREQLDKILDEANAPLQDEDDQEALEEADAEEFVEGENEYYDTVEEEIEEDDVEEPEDECPFLDDDEDD